MENHTFFLYIKARSLKKFKAVFLASSIIGFLVLIVTTALLVKNERHVKESSGAGNSYYVSPVGTGTTCSPSLPCSQSTGYSKLAVGDTLYFKSGTYIQSGTLYISKSGNTYSTAPGEPSRAILSGDSNHDGVADVPVDWTFISVNGENNTFNNLEIAYSTGVGIFLNASGDKILNSNVHHIWETGIYLHGPNNVADGNLVWRTDDSNYCGGIGGSRGCNGDWGGGIVAGDSSATDSPGKAPESVISNNVIYNNSGEGIDCEHNDNTTIKNNIVYDNWAMGIYSDQCSYLTIKNNLVYYTSDKAWWRGGSYPNYAISLSNEGITNYPMGHDNLIINNIAVGGGTNLDFYVHRGFPGAYMKNYLFANNTLINAQGDSNAYGVVIGSAPNINTSFINNIIYQSSGSLASVQGSGLNFSNNLWSKTPPSNISGAGDVIANPLLTDANHAVSAGSVNANWYKLISQSPAINKGKYLSQVTEDFFGNSRSNPPDIGAHEYGGSVNITQTPTTAGQKPGDCGGPNGTPDGYVDLFDYGSLARSFGLTQGQPGFNAKCDFYVDSHNIIDLLDYGILAQNFGR